jgi:hypothetical protein
MSKPHKHSDLIKLWADGAEIQWRDPKYADSGWDDIKEPSWVTCYQYRIKPEEKKLVVRWLWANINGCLSTEFYSEEDMIKNGYPEQWIRLEWSRQEFSE